MEYVKGLDTHNSTLIGGLNVLVLRAEAVIYPEVKVKKTIKTLNLNSMLWKSF